MQSSNLLLAGKHWTHQAKFGMQQPSLSSLSRPLGSVASKAFLLSWRRHMGEEYAVIIYIIYFDIFNINQNIKHTIISQENIQQNGDLSVCLLQE